MGKLTGVMDITVVSSVVHALCLPWKQRRPLIMNPPSLLVIPYSAFGKSWTSKLGPAPTGKNPLIDLMVSCDRGPTDLDDVHIVARKTQLTVALRELLNHFPFRSSKMGAFGDFPPIVFFGCPASVDLMRVRFACTDRCDRGGEQVVEGSNVKSVLIQPRHFVIHMI